MGQRDLETLIGNEMLFEEQRKRTEQSLNLGFRKNPDQFSKSIKLGQETGTSPDFAEKHKQELEIQKRMRVTPVGDLVRTAPKTAEFLSDPNNAGAFHDAIPQLSTFEQILMKPVDLGRSLFGEGVLKSTVGSTLSGASTLLDVGARALDRPIRRAFGDKIADMFWYEPLRLQGIPLDPLDVLKQGGADFKQLGEIVAPPKDRRGFDTDVAAGIGQLTGQIATFLVTGGTSTAVTLFSQGVDVMDTKLKDDRGDGPLSRGLGIESDVAKDSARLAGGAITVITEKYGLDKILNRVPPAIKNRTLRFIADKAAAGGIEFAQEITEGLLVDLTRKVLTNENAEILEGALEEGGVAALSAAIVRAALGVKGYRQAKRQEELINALDAVGKDPKLMGRLPEKVQEFIAGVSQTGPIKNVFIPVEQFNTFYQTQNRDPIQAAQEMGAINYAEAVSLGTEVVVPIDQFARVVAPTDDLQGLAPDLKFSQGERTAREREQDLKDQAAREEEIIAEAQASVGEINTPAAQQIRDDMAGQLIAAGTERVTAEAQATQYAKVISNLAQRAGIDPLVLHQEYNLRVTRPLPEVLTRDTRADVNIDPLLDRLRSAKGIEDTDIFGQSLVEFVREQGGILPSGELLDADMGNRPFQRNLVQAEGLSADQVAERAVQAGYFPGKTVGDITERDIFDALDEELRGGNLTYAPANFNEDLLNLRDTLNQLGDYLDSLGIDVNTITDNAQVRQLIDAATQQAGLGDQLNELYQRVEGGKNAITGDLERVNQDVREAVNDRIARLPAEDQQRIRDNLERYKGTAWAAAAVKGMAYREMLERAIVGQDISALERNDIWGAQDMSATKLIQAFKKFPQHGDKILQVLMNSYEFIGGNRKAENDISTSFANCDPSLACATHCYAAGSNARPNEIAKSEFTEFMLERFPEQMAEKIAGDYLATAAGKAGLALRLNDKGDLSPAQVTLVNNLNARGIAVQVFSKRPELLRTLSDVNLKMLSVDSTNLDVARANPDLRLAVTITDDMTQDMLKEIDERVSVYLPVNLKGKAWTAEELKQAFPELYEKMKRETLCPVDGGRKTTTPGTSFVNILDRTSEKNVWTCTACDYTGAAGCFNGDRKTNQRKASVVLVSDLQKELQTKRVRAELQANLDTLLSLGGIDGELHKQLSEALSSGQRAAQSIAGYSSETGTVEGSGGAAEAFAAGGDRTGQSLGGDTKLYQGLDQGDPLSDKRGFIQFGANRKFNIALLEKANLSTFLHETGHFYLEVMGDLAERPDASEQLKTDYAAILKYLGLTSRAELTLDGKTAGSAEYNRAVEAHERFARSNEAYLMEGKAPSEELRALFQKFKSWLGLIYKSFQSLDVKLTNEIREVFDRIYATDAEIEAAKDIVAVEQMFATAADMGVTEAEFAAYANSVADTVESGKEALQAKLMKELQRERAEWWKKAKAEMRAEVEVEVDLTPVYAAFKTLTDGKLEDGTPIRLNKQALVERYGDEYLKRLPRSFGRIYTRQGGMDPESAAEFLGFESGDTLIEALAGMKPRKEYIDAEVERRMREVYGDMMTDGTIADEAIAALHNSQRENVLMIELKALRRKQREVAPFVRIERQRQADERRQARAAIETPPASAFRAAAQGLVGQTALRDLDPYKHLQASRKAARESAKALAGGDFQTAAEAKQREILNHYMYLEASKAREEADSILKYAQRFEKGTTREQMGKAGANYLEQIDAILDRYEFRRVPLSKIDRRQSLDQWIRDQEAQGLEPSIDARLLNESRLVNYRQVSIDELRAVRDTVKNIEHLARLKNKIVTKNKEFAFQEAIAEMVASAENSGQRRMLPPDLNAMTLREKAGDIVSRLDAPLLKMEQLVEWLDNGRVDGPWHTYLWNPIAQAQNDENDLHRELTTKIVDSLDKMPKDQRRSMLDTFQIPGIGRVTRKYIISMALNMGNDENMNKMLRGHGWTMEDVQTALDKLSDADWRFVQDTWDNINSLWPQIVELEKRMTGLAPKKVEARPYVVRRNGQEVMTVAGGYFPLVYDPRFSEQGAKQESGNLGQMFEEGYVRATTSKGHTEARSEGFAAPLNLDFEMVLTQHMANVVKDLTHREAIVAANKILTNPEIRKVLQETMSPAIEKQMMPWLRSVVNDRNSGTSQGLSDFSRWMMSLRSNTVAAVMGFKATTAIMQISGLSSALDKVGKRDLAVALKDFMRHPVAMTREVRELSGEMRNRPGSLDRDIRGQLRSMTGQNGLLTQAQRFAFHGITLADTMVTVPTWMAAYRRALADGKSQEVAILEGDAAVRLTQGAGGPKDLAAVSRNNELMKALTMFYSYFSTLYNRMRNMGREVQSIRDMPRFLSKALFVVMIPAVMGDLIVGRGPDDEEEYPEWLARKILLYPLMTIPLLRDIASSVDSGFDYKFSPLASGLEKLSKLAKVGYKALTDEDEVEWDKVAVNAAETIGYLAGVPGTAQMSATGKYLWRVEEGEEEADNFAELLFYAAVGKRKEK